MVLEHLFPDSWLEKKIGVALFLGFVYTIIGIILARLLFGANSGIVSVMFISILLIPSLRKLFKQEEKQEEKEKSFTLKHFYRDNKHLIFAYIGIFFGVYVAYFLTAYLSASLGWDVTRLFGEQLFLDPAISGRAVFDLNLFWSILSNNWWVLLACFLLSVLSGDGATFFIVWNASAWASIFAIRAFSAGEVLGVSGFSAIASIVFITLPHVILEGGSYILAGITGSVISDDAISESKNLKQFLLYLAVAIGLFTLGNFVLKSLVSYAPLLMLFRLVLVLVLVHFLGRTFPDKKHQEVFTYNYWLFVLAVAIFILGALVETGVLSYSDTLNMYYSASQSFFAG
ncbi:MAG: hypothetical protein ACQESC_04585 [Nanobdellota archaeon]